MKVENHEDSNQQKRSNGMWDARRDLCTTNPPSKRIPCWHECSDIASKKDACQQFAWRFTRLYAIFHVNANRSLKKIGPGKNKKIIPNHEFFQRNEWELRGREKTSGVAWYCWWFRNPIPNHLFLKPVVNNGLNYQLQLVSLPDFWTINSRNGYYQPQPVSAGFLNHQQYVGVSKNNGTPKSSILIGFSMK